MQNLLEKWQLLNLFGVTLIERSSSWKYIYKCLRYLNLVLRWSRSITSKEYKAIWLWSVLCTHLVLKLEDKDQTQDEDEIWVLVTIGNHLVERKELKQLERKGLKKDLRLFIKLSLSLGSINQVISSECQEWFLERCHFSLV